MDSLNVDTINASHSGDLNVPAEYADYRIIVSNNVYNLPCKSSLTTKLLDSKKVIRQVDNELKRFLFITTFSKEEAHIFNYILDRSDLVVNDMFCAILAAYQFFTEYEISCKTVINIDKYINCLGNYKRTWTGLTSKPDYNLTIFTNRTLPYFSLECMDWVKANIDTLKGDYPAELAEARKAKIAGHATVTDDYHEEMRLIQKNNNFLEWQLLPIDKYPNMKTLISQIETLSLLGLKRQALSMICKLMISPRECHIIKCPEIWRIIGDELSNSDFLVLIKYCMFYAMYILKQEETIMFSQINTKSRVLFTLEEARTLPTFNGGHIERSPYMIQLTNDTPIGQTMPFYLQGNRYINSKEEFERRLFIASGGAFKGVDFKNIGAAITGSILLPCAHRSPLEDGFELAEWDRSRKTINVQYPYMIDTPTTTEDIAFANYLEYYYPSYVSLTDEDYKKQVLSAKMQSNESVVESGELEYDNSDDIPKIIGGVKVLNDRETKLDIPVYEDNQPETPKQKIQVVRVKPQEIPAAALPENAAPNNSVLDPDTAENKTQRNATEYNQLADIDISITTSNVSVFKERALALYETIRKNCEHRGAVHIKEIKTIASIKYKVYGPGIPRPMDIFRIPYDPAKMVKKFHVNAVKMYYDGNVTLVRSCVSCLLSGVGETYKWFSCNKIPADVLLKYAQRGFSIVLNTKERDAISKYIMASERWGNMLKTLNIKPKKIYCCVTKNHPFFRPGIYNCGIRLGLRKFERDVENLYTNTLVIEKPKHVYPYGEVLTNDLKNIYMPDISLIPAILDYIDNSSIITDSTDNSIDIE